MLIFGQLVGIQPDAHGILAAEFVHFPHPRHPRKHLLQAGLGIVPQVIPVHAPVFRNQADDQQVVSGGLAHLHPLLLHHLRQARHGQLELVLHLGPGQVRIGARAQTSAQRGKMPDESLVADKYSILSKPVIFCSMICVTLFSTVSADAPG